MLYHFTDSKFFFLLDKAVVVILWSFGTHQYPDTKRAPLLPSDNLVPCLCCFCTTSLYWPSPICKRQPRCLEKDSNYKSRHTKSKTHSVEFWGFCWISGFCSTFDFCFTSTTGCYVENRKVLREFNQNTLLERKLKERQTGPSRELNEDYWVRRWQGKEHVLEHMRGSRRKSWITKMGWGRDGKWMSRVIIKGSQIPKASSARRLMEAEPMPSHHPWPLQWEPDSSVTTDTLRGYGDFLFIADGGGLVTHGSSTRRTFIWTLPHPKCVL